MTSPDPSSLTKPDFVMQTYIRCTPDALWDALGDPVQMSKYHFMADRIDRDGDTLRFYTPDGALMLVCRELSVDRPGNRVEITFEPQWDPNAVASRVVYLVVQEGDHCRLTVEHYGLQYGADGVGDGWARLLAGLKSWLETGRPARFGAPMPAPARA
jgi:uncharacterized protein YndB with AHSA1/START domain